MKQQRNPAWRCFLAGVFAIVATAADRGNAVAILLEKSEDGAAIFKIVNWDSASVSQAVDWPKMFAVYAGANRASGMPPILGSYKTEGKALTFRPRFPLEPGLRYRAVFRPPGIAEITAIFDIPKPASLPSTTVEHIYPSASRLPENQLKFYIHFTAPMSRGEAYKRIRLVDESGAQVSLPFLELEQELWDRDGKRLMILFDPGRIKRGLLPNEEVGSPILDGKKYSLIVDARWPDAAGNPLKEEFRKSFSAGPADRTPPDPKTWRLTAPKAGSSGALLVSFGEPMDRALLDRLLQVIDPAGKSMDGAIDVDQEETRWRFTPRQAWKPGDYLLMVGTTLEDLAGNTIGRPFDVDLFERVEERITREARPIRFTVE